MFWDDVGKPACWHGVTTVVMGNCGFTLAPARLHERALVVRNLERAEDIAAEAMAQGLTWNWQTFGEYLDAVEARLKGVNYAACVGHSALRTWAMGERAFDEDATEHDLAVMAAELRSALRAGAVGFTTSRSGHVASDGRPVASRRARWEEIAALVEIVGLESDAVFQLALARRPDPDFQRQFQGDLQRLAVSSGAPIVFGMFATPALAQPSIEFMDETAALGGAMYGLTHCRGVMSGQSFLTRLGFDSLVEWPGCARSPAR